MGWQAFTNQAALALVDMLLAVIKKNKILVVLVSRVMFDQLKPNQIPALG